MSINIPTLTQLKDTLNLQNVDDVLLTSLMTDSAEMVIETAMLRFLATLGEWEQESFETWIELHANDNDLISELVTLYPNFGRILTEGILELQNIKDIQTQL